MEFTGGHIPDFPQPHTLQVDQATPEGPAILVSGHVTRHGEMAGNKWVSGV